MTPPTAIIVLLPLLSSISLLIPTASAASGGRMGGDSFSSPPSSPSPSRSSSSDYDYLHDHHPPYHLHHHHPHYHHPSESSKSDQSSWVPIIVQMGFFGTVSWIVYLSIVHKKRAVIMLQVGLNSNARPLLGELNHIANMTDTSSSTGWQKILMETTLALSRHSGDFISGYSCVKRYWRAESVEKSFNELKSEERKKFSVESLVNVNNERNKRAVAPKVTKSKKDYIVVTILVAARGAHKIPDIRSNDDMELALNSFNIKPSNLLAVEVLWTPQDENDTLTEEEFLEQYPLLRPI